MARAAGQPTAQQRRWSLRRRRVSHALEVTAVSPRRWPCSTASRRTRTRWVVAQGGAGHRALGLGCDDGRPTTGKTSSARERGRRCRPWMSSSENRPEKGKQRGNSQTMMDSRKEWQDGVEDDELYLVVVLVDAGTRWFGRKSSPKSSSET